jgi:hypothetical protein
MLGVGHQRAERDKAGTDERAFSLGAVLRNIFMEFGVGG